MEGGFYPSIVNRWGGVDRCGGLINPVLCSSYIQVDGWSAAPISGVSHCRPKLLQVANLIALCHCPCVRRRQVVLLFVLARPQILCTYMRGHPAGGAVDCGVLVRGPGGRLQAPHSVSSCSCIKVCFCSQRKLSLSSAQRFRNRFL